MGPKKVSGWNDGTGHLYIITQNLVEIERRTSAWEDEVWCFLLYFLFVCHTVARRRFPFVAAVTIFNNICRPIKMEFASFFCGIKALSAYRTVFKIVARWRYDWCPNGQKIENLRKWVQSLCAPFTSTIYKRDERKLLSQHFTPCIVDVHPYKIFR